MNDFEKMNIRRFSCSERATVDSTFQDSFEVPFSRFIDGMMSAMWGYIIIDITKFDDFLHNKFGEYDDKGLSMRELVIQEYDKNAADFINTLLP